MGAMSFEVPDGASVQIIVGKAAPLALSDDTGRPREPTRKAGFWRTTLKGLVAVALLAGGYAVGQHSSGANGSARLGTAQAAVTPAPGPVQHAFPDHPLATDHPSPAPAPMSDQVPPTFTQQLQQPPTVVPPPGQPTGAAAPAKNAFGLEN
jgi:hypothetical protein